MFEQILNKPSPIHNLEIAMKNWRNILLVIQTILLGGLKETVTALIQVGNEITLSRYLFTFLCFFIGTTTGFWVISNYDQVMISDFNLSDFKIIAIGYLVTFLVILATHLLQGEKTQKMLHANVATSFGFALAVLIHSANLPLTLFSWFFSFAVPIFIYIYGINFIQAALNGNLEHGD